MDFIHYYKVLTPDEEYDNVIVLDDESLITVKHKGDMLAQIQESFMLYQSVIFNVYNLQKCVMLYANDTVELTDSCPTEIQDTTIVINTLIANIFSSAKTLTDKMQTIIKKYCNDKSFLQEITDVYESSYSYRLAQGLRNMCQHGFCVVSKCNERYGLDLYQLRYVKDFTVNGSFKETLDDLIEKFSMYSCAPKYSLSALISEYTTDVIGLYLHFLENIRPSIEELDLQLKCFMAQNPELLKHNNPGLSGALLIKDNTSLHIVPAKESLLKTIDFYIKDVEKQLSLFKLAEAAVESELAKI